MRNRTLAGAGIGAAGGAAAGYGSRFIEKGIRGRMKKKTASVSSENSSANDGFDF